MIDCFFGDAFGVLSCQFWSTVLKSGARLPIHQKLLYRAVSGTEFLTGGVFDCDNAHRRSVAVICMLYKSRCNPINPLNGALPESYVPVLVTRGALVAQSTLMHRLAAEHRSTAILLFPSRYPSGTILLSPYSMVWDWRVSRARPMFFLLA